MEFIDGPLLVFEWVAGNNFPEDRIITNE
uniref:Putative oxidoreductase KpLE2 phage-like element n=1 Tax=mine drainage metagenome TaxID=410659 RepID=E6QJ40_9ZZZZ